MPTKIESILIRHLAVASCAGQSRRELESLIEAKYPGAIQRRKEQVVREREAARWIGNPPAWARAMVKKWAYAQSTKLTWRRSRFNHHTSGHCKYWSGGIVLTAGADEQDQRVVLVHEIAHANAPWDGHGATFYEEVVRIAKGTGLLRASQERYGQGRGVKAAARKARRK